MTTTDIPESECECAWDAITGKQQIRICPGHRALLLLGQARVAYDPPSALGDADADTPCHEWDVPEMVRVAPAREKAEGDLGCLLRGVEALAERAELLRAEHLDGGSPTRAGAWHAVATELRALLDTRSQTGSRSNE